MELRGVRSGASLVRIGLRRICFYLACLAGLFLTGIPNRVIADDLARGGLLETDHVDVEFAGVPGVKWLLPKEMLNVKGIIVSKRTMFRPKTVRLHGAIQIGYEYEVVEMDEGIEEKKTFFVQLRTKDVSAQKVYPKSQKYLPDGVSVKLKFDVDLIATPEWEPGNVHYVRELIAGHRTTITSKWKKENPGRSVSAFLVKSHEEKSGEDGE